MDAVESISISNPRCIESTRTMVSDLHRKGIASGRLMNRLRLYMREGTLQQMHSCSNVMLSSDHQPIEEAQEVNMGKCFPKF